MRKRLCTKESEREVSERREAERKCEKERERGALISECILCICCTRRDCHHLTDKKNPYVILIVNFENFTK